MKRAITTSLSVIGALSLLLFAFILIARAFAPGYEEDARRQFGTPEAIADIARLYERIERTKPDIAVKYIVEAPHVRAYPQAYRVPRSWLPERFQLLWGAVMDEPYIENSDVVAYYDSAHTLLGIEFTGSRFGCFVSRDPSLTPLYWKTLHRLAESPLFITARIDSD